MFERLFNPDNPVLIFINKIIDLFVVSLIWTVCCLPIVTIGPACCALYYAVVKSVRQQRSYATTEFFREFKNSMKKGIIVTLVLILLTVAMLVSDIPLMLTFLNTGKVYNTFLFVLFCIKLYILLGAACWICPLMSRFNETLSKLAEATLFLIIRYVYVTIPAIIILAAAVVIIKIEWLFLAFVPGVTTLLLSFLLEPALKKMEEMSND